MELWNLEFWTFAVMIHILYVYRIFVYRYSLFICIFWCVSISVFFSSRTYVCVYGMVRIWVTRLQSDYSYLHSQSVLPLILLFLLPSFFSHDLNTVTNFNHSLGISSHEWIDSWNSQNGVKCSRYTLTLNLW